MGKFLNMFRPPSGLVRSMWGLIALTIGCLTISSMAPQTCFASGHVLDRMQALPADTNLVTMKEQGRICDLIVVADHPDVALPATTCVGRDNSGHIAALINCEPATSVLLTRNSATEPIGWHNSVARTDRRQNATNQTVWWRDYDQVPNDTSWVLIN